MTGMLVLQTTASPDATTSLTLPQLTIDSKFIADLGLDSLDVVECVMAIEEEFCACRAVATCHHLAQPSS